MSLATYAARGLPNPNDLLDSDSGANTLQNFPEIVSAIADGTGVHVLADFLTPAVAQTYVFNLSGHPAISVPASWRTRQRLFRSSLRLPRAGCSIY